MVSANEVLKLTGNRPVVQRHNYETSFHKGEDFEILRTIVGQNTDMVAFSVPQADSKKTTLGSNIDAFSLVAASGPAQ
jgi:hypothetical protein